jgi:hypothetical protein
LMSSRLAAPTAITGVFGSNAIATAWPPFV